MGGLDLVVIALVAVIAIGTGQGSPVQPEEAIPTSCPAVDPMDRTIHLAHEVMCSLFYKCQAGEKIVQLCAHRSNGQLLYFNPELQVCDWPANVTCNYRSCILDSFGNPVKVPYDGSCQHYYDCVNEELTLRRCPDGMKFDGHLKQCVMDSSAVCGSIQKKCDSIYMEPLADSCSFYVICLAGKNVVLPCPAGKFFSRSRQDCVDEINADCKPPIMTPHPSDCKLYYYNQDGMKVVRYCEAGLHFNPLSQKCEEPDEAGCTASTPLPPANGRKCNGNFKRPHPTECRLFFECVDGIEKPRVCDDGLHFNPFSHECQTPIEAGCDDSIPCPSPKPQPECTGNKKIAYPDDCRVYQQCENGIMQSKVCDEGLHFNETVQECQMPCEARCDKNLICPTPSPEPTPSPAPECLGDVRLSHECDCRIYYQCVDGSKKLRLCDDGLHFNSTVQKCQLPCDAKCDKSLSCSTPTPTPTPTEIPTPTPTEVSPTPTPKPECNGDKKIPLKCDCSMYVECNNGVREVKTCDEGLHFNPYDQECQDPCDAGCDKSLICPTPTPSTELPTSQQPECTGENKIPHADCGFYYQCEDGIIVTKSCAEGLHFNPYDQQCEDPCDAGCDKNQICSSASPTTEQPTTQEPECTGDNKTPHADCGFYYQCEDGIIVTKSCGEGLHFNPFIQVCQEPCDAGCDKNQVCSTASPTTEQPTTQQPECTGNNKIPHADCGFYYQCEDGIIVTKSCAEGLHFNPYDQQCQDPCDAGCDKNQICSTASPTTEQPTTQEPECTGDNKTPHADCGFYYQCEDGIIVTKSCEEGLHFNPFIQVCQEPCDAGCDKNQICSTASPTTEQPTTEQPECVASDLSPHECDCKLYYECVNGIKEIRSCRKGMHFNQVLQKCQNPNEAGCKYANGPVNQCFGSFKVPHEYSCRRYYECENSKKIPKACPAGKHFSTHAQACLDPKDAKVEC